MQITWNEIYSRALQFIEKWDKENSEVAEAKSFLDDFFEVFGIDRKRVGGKYEKRVDKIDGRNGYIDLLWPGVILVEMKSRSKSLDKAYKQARDYFFGLEDAELPKVIMVCDFARIRLYLCEKHNKMYEFDIKNLYKKIHLFDFLSYEKKNIPVSEVGPVNRKAAEKMAILHDKLKKIGYVGHALEVYLVRILFCLFADYTLIWDRYLFYNYILASKRDGSNLSMRLSYLFEYLQLSPQERIMRKNISEEVINFTYINGRLFEEHLPHADFDSNMREILLDCCRYDWSQISPAIFGSIFQNVVDESERRKLGEHYTSEDNIMKLIKPLFLDELYKEYESCKNQQYKLRDLLNKLKTITFLDPACGCGNFLIISYRELRKLELIIMNQLKALRACEIQTYFLDIKDVGSFSVNVNQFYGIECKEFPCQISKVAMWLMDHLMNLEASEFLGETFIRVPLITSANIIQENALLYNWNEIAHETKIDYIIGNPPFNGARIMSSDQKKDIRYVFKNLNGSNNLDYVSAWFGKSCDYITHSIKTKIAFVATNSIVEGQQAGILFQHLIQKYDIKINYAYRTFKWNNEAKRKAQVHCVIIGIVSNRYNSSVQTIYDGEKIIRTTECINEYLLNAPYAFIMSRSKQISGQKEMLLGNMPNDAKGNLILSANERNELVDKYPFLVPYLRRFVGAKEFIHGIEKYCMWFKDAPPEVCDLSEFYKRFEMIKNTRKKSNREKTKELADYPMLFGEVRQPDNGIYLAIPRHSSEKRKYVPIGYMTADIIAGDSMLIIPGADKYLFGIIVSSVHMLWMKYICGRIRTGYRYSANIVYNNFPIPDCDVSLKSRIESCVDDVLDIREEYNYLSYAKMYSEYMPPKLTRAHYKLDKMVEELYGVRCKNEMETIEKLINLYLQLK